MNRLVSFRAWADNGMRYGGFIVHATGKIESEWHPVEEIEKTLMQYTGLKDKNGKEIYEGDIVENEAIRDKVVFHKGMFCLSRNRNNRMEYQALHIHSGLKVIGNIYEDSALIEEEHE